MRSSIVTRILEQHGLRVQRFDTSGSPILVGRADGQSEQTLLFYNHYDVEPPEPLELWTTPPFQPSIRDGALYARGVADDKGELIARLAAIDAVRAAHDGIMPCGVTFVVEGEEEIGSPHLEQFVRENVHLLKCHAAIWEDGGTDFNGNPRMDLGYRGILCVEIVAETMRMDAHSGSAHVLPNAAWRLFEVLKSLKGPDERILVPGFYDDARQPSEHDLELLDALPNYELWARETLGVRKFVGDLKGKDLGRAVFNCTCNISSLTSGYQGEGSRSVIPSRAAAKIDFRLIPDQDPTDILEKLRSYFNRKDFADVEVTNLAAMRPYKTDTDNAFVVIAKHAAEVVYQRPCLISPLAGESGPIYIFADSLGHIPIINAGIGNTNNGIHAPNEYIRLTDFVNGTRHIALILTGFGEG